jgi:hypothetical protein
MREAFAVDQWPMFLLRDEGDGWSSAKCDRCRGEWWGATDRVMEAVRAHADCRNSIGQMSLMDEGISA